MKANELMIGDWVNLVDEGNTTPMQITSISMGEDYEHRHPIPLTPEILRDNGFTYEGKYYNNTSLPCAAGAFWIKGNYNNDGYAIGYHAKSDITNRDEYMLQINCFLHRTDLLSSIRLYGIEYVHELQHALRLCGLNALAENFKV